MPINLLGRESKRTVNKNIGQEVKMHIPEKEKIAAPAPKPEPKPEVKPITEPSFFQPEEVNLVTGVKSLIFKRRLLFLVITIVIIILLAAVAVLLVNYWQNRPQPVNNPPVTNINNAPPMTAVCGNGTLEADEQCDQSECGLDQTCVNCQCQTNIPAVAVCNNGLIESGEQCDQSDCGVDQICLDCQCQAKIQEPVCGNSEIEAGEQCDLTGCQPNQTCVNCQCQIVILPDTELTPLRGALVKFNNETNLYLIDFNGELRSLNQQTTIFNNGQLVSQINSQLIYQINDSYKNIRKGNNISGKILFDPRVLTAEELQPFL